MLHANPPSNLWKKLYVASGFFVGVCQFFKISFDCLTVSVGFLSIFHNFVESHASITLSISTVNNWS